MMKNIKLAYKKLFRKGEQTSAKVISLAAGLAFGIILLAEVFYYFSFDSFYPEADNIYVVHENFRMDKSQKDLSSHPRVSGAIGPGLQAEVPGVTVATRLNNFANGIFYTQDKKSYQADFSLADKHWQDVIPRPMVNGDAREILTQPMQCIISDKLAEKMGGNVIEKTIELKDYPGKELTIKGIFKAVPENTLYEYDVLVSMISTKEFTWDGTKNWLGNDRYYTCVKLEKGLNPKDLASAIRKMQEKHQDILEFEKKNPGAELTYTFKPIKKIYSSLVKDMILILSLIAFAVLFVSLMNYILLTISSLINRAKSSAIYKCYGAQAKHLQKMILAETAIIFAISLALTALIIYLVAPFLESQLGHKVSSMFNIYVMLPIVGLMLVILFAISYVPGRFFARIPVAAAFRNYRQKGNKWKLALLSIQFFGAAFILTLLSVVVLQYEKMLDASHGYNTKNIYYTYASGIDGSKVQVVLNELKNMPEIENVGMGYDLPLSGASGNNVYSSDGEKELFNVADFYTIDENYMKILDIPIIRGAGFDHESAVEGSVMISRKGEEKLMVYNDWNDGVIDKHIGISEHHSNGNATTIIGVFDDFIIGNMATPDLRPSVFFYRPQDKFTKLLAENPEYSCVILVKAQIGQAANIIKKITDIVNIAMPHKDAVVKSMEEQQRILYQPQKGFRNAMLAGSLVILLITLMGLVGYTNSEVNRRRKDLAIRKINGATLTNILRMFLWDLERVAIPAVAIGLGLAWFVAGKWMQNFAAKISLNWVLFATCSLAILGLIALVAIFSYRRIGNQNPVEALRYE